MNNNVITQLGTTVKTVGGNSDKQLESNINTILTSIIGVLGLVCVVVMIVGGINYMTSAGDTNKVEKGKKTILYGAIGLIICALSFAIVNFVISDIIKPAASSYTEKTACEDAGYTWKNSKCVEK